MPNKTEKVAEIQIAPIEEGQLSVVLFGTSPLLFNRMAEKARRDLLFPSGRKTEAEKAGTLKHDPLREYRASVYRCRKGDPTLIGFPAPGVKGAMAKAAIDLPEVAKAKIDRLVWVSGYSVPVWGLPRLKIDVVRNLGMNRTPDIRTRACIENWVMGPLTINFVKPILNQTAIVNLLVTAGRTIGLGDFRQEKGKGSFGQFTLGKITDPEVKACMAYGWDQQQAALIEPEYFDEESEEMVNWYEETIIARGREDLRHTDEDDEYEEAAE